MFHATTSFDSTYTDAILKAEITIANESKEKADGLTVNFILKDAAGKIIPLPSASSPVPTIINGKQKLSVYPFPLPSR